MASRPPNPLLLLTPLFFCQCSRGQSLFTIDTVGLTISPGSTVQSGSPATLRCQVIVSHDSSFHQAHTFQLTRDDVSVYSSTTTDDVVLYELSPARAADSGSYECRVTVGDKTKNSFSQKLNVTGLQTPTLELTKAIVYESEEFTATCSAPNEKGSLAFGFYQKFRTGETQRIKQTAPAGNSSNTKLVLRQIGDSHLFCDYEISLASGSRRSHRSNETQVIVRGLYISPTMNLLPASAVYEGDIIEVVCKVVSPLRDVEVFLTRDRRILKKALVSLNHQFRVQEGDSGELVCKAEWGNVQKETYQTITVKSLFSQPRLTLDPKEIFEGDRFKLTCSVSIYVPEKINNETMRYSIYKDNVKVVSADSFTTVAHPAKNGNYTCKAQAASLTHSFVKESPACVVQANIPVSKPVLSVVGAMLVLGKPFQLLCHSDSGTLPISYTLYGPDRMPEVKVVSSPGEQAIFNTSAIVKSSDISRLLCHAKNTNNKPPMIGSGQQLLASTKIIEPVSNPVLATLPAGDLSEGEELTLTCAVHRGTPPITFTWYHANHAKGALFSKRSERLKESHRISNVRGEHRGGYYCVCTNQANETKQSPTVHFGVKLAGWKKGLIAVFCILLLLAGILALVFRRRLIGFKRKRTAELSVKSVGTKAERLSLTQAEVNEVANVTPGMMGKSVWSEHVSGSESDDQNSVMSPENKEPQYTEVQTRQADPERAPVKKGTDTVYSEIRNSKQGVPPLTADGQGSVEYAQLNHDTDHHGNQDIQDDHLDEIDNSGTATAEAQE